MVATMVYDDDKYIDYFNKVKRDIVCIKIEKKKDKFSLVETDRGKGIELDEEDPESSIENLFRQTIVPDAVYWNLNNLISSINLTIEFLISSYSLLQMEYDGIQSSKEDNPNMYWYIFHYENTIARISTLNDLLINLTNYALELNYKEDQHLRKNVLSSLKQKNNQLKSIIKRGGFQTKSIRNDSFHNTKPFYYKDSIEIKDGLIAVGQGDRNFNLIDDFPKIDADIQYLKQKYLDAVPQLSLKFLDN